MIDDHPLRFPLVNELHARPFPSLSVPGHAVYVAVKQPLDAHNRDDPARPIYLLHGAWLIDPAEGEDLYSLTERFDATVLETVSSVHGELDAYATDVSDWVLGWLVGREVLATEVLRTDANHPEVTSYDLSRASTRSASPPCA